MSVSLLAIDVPAATAVFERYVVSAALPLSPSMVDYHHALEWFLQEAASAALGNSVEPNPYADIPVSVVLHASSAELY